LPATTLAADRSPAYRPLSMPAAAAPATARPPASPDHPACPPAQITQFGRSDISQLTAAPLRQNGG